MSGASYLLAEVASRNGVSVLDLQSARRGAVLDRARDEAMWRLRDGEADGYPMPLKAIGSLLGNRDHASVLKAVRRHQALLEGR